MADTHAHDNHGKTPAAWAGSLTALVGAVIAAIGVALSQNLIMWIGLGVCLLAAVVGGAMSRAGRGSTARSKATPTRDTARSA